MRRCENCGLSVRSAGDTCPLCHVPLSEGAPDAPDYPAYACSVQKRREHAMWRRIVRFVLVCAALGCGFLNLLLGGEPWSLTILATSAVCLLVERVIHSRASVGVQVLAPALALILYLILLDILTGYTGWSLDFLAPLILLATMIVMSSLALARQLRARDYLMFFLALAGFSLIPLILSWAGVIKVAWPSLTTALTAAVLLAALFIFGDRTMLHELRRKFHL